MVLMKGPNNVPDSSRRVMMTGTRYYLIVSNRGLEPLLLVLSVFTWFPRFWHR